MIRPVSGRKPLPGILGGDAALHRGAAHLHRILAQAKVGQGLPRRDAQLARHQVDVGDLLGDGVLDLDAGIALDEHVMTAFVEKELHCACAGVADLPGERDGVGADPHPQLVGQIRRGRELDHLLVPALHAAVPFEQVDDVALTVGQDLHLDVPRVQHGLFEVDRRVAERRLGLAAGGFDRLGQSLGFGHPPHPAPATSGHRLDEQRELHVRGGGDELVHRGRRRRRVKHRQARLLRRRDRTGLVARQLQHVGARTDEGDARLGARCGQLGVLGEETVSGVHGIGAGVFGDADDLLDRQVGADRTARLTDLVGLVGLQSMRRVAILVRVHRDGQNAHLVGGTERTDGDLTAVGHQEFRDHALP